MLCVFSVHGQLPGERLCVLELPVSEAPDFPLVLARSAKELVLTRVKAHFGQEVLGGVLCLDA